MTNMMKTGAHPLAPDAKLAIKDWFVCDGVVPIHHMLVIHQDVSKRPPDVVRDLYLKHDRSASFVKAQPV